jgi:hypothetical protein
VTPAQVARWQSEEEAAAERMVAVRRELKKRQLKEGQIAEERKQEAAFRRMWSQRAMDPGIEQ